MTPVTKKFAHRDLRPGQLALPATIRTPVLAASEGAVNGLIDEFLGC